MISRLAVVALLPCVALMLQWLLWPWIQPSAWFLFLPTLFLCARLGGQWGALIGTGLSAVLVWYFFIPKQLPWEVADPSQVWSVVLFLTVGALVSGDTARLERIAKGKYRAEESLRKFSRVIEQTASTVVITDPDGVIEYVNPRFSEISGYASAEAVGRRPSLLKSGQTPPDQYRQMWHTILAGGVWHGEFHNRRKDGTLYWESAIISPIRDDTGRITHFLGIKDDITARKAAEAALRESEATLQKAQHMARLGHWKWDLREDRATWSEEMYRIVGRDPALGPANLQEVPRYFTPESWARLSAAVDLAVRDGTPYEVDAEVVRADGSRGWVLARGEVVRDHSGAIIELRGMMQDITRRKEVEAALAAREAQYRAAIETSSDGFCMLDESGRLLAVNDAYVRRSGYSRDELCAMSVARLQARASPEEVHARMERIRSQGSDLFETRHRAKNGESWPVEVSASYSEAAGRRFFEFLRDIGERKQAEAALRELRTELEQMLTLHVASQTAAAIAHELNQPLNAVTTYTEAAVRLLRAGNPKPDRLLHALDSSAHQAQRAAKVVRQLIAFLHKGEAPTEKVDLNDSVRRALAMAESNGFGGFQAVVDLAPGLRPVQANRVQVDKVLLVLLQNGVDAMRAAGVPTPAITISVRTSTEAHMAQVTVRDSGPGLDEATAQRVFEPFFTTKSKGIGMGLAISRSLIEAHGGKMWLELNKGDGATFHFTLPFAR